VLEAVPPVGQHVANDEAEDEVTGKSEQRRGAHRHWEAQRHRQPLEHGEDDKVAGQRDRQVADGRRERQPLGDEGVDAREGQAGDDHRRHDGDDEEQRVTDGRGAGDADERVPERLE
jgi:hypothetical protein